MSTGRTPTAAATPGATPPQARARPQRTGSLAGTGTLLRFMLRRDRIRFPVWVLAMTAMTAYCVGGVGAVMDDEALASMAFFITNPVTGLIGGPGFGLDDPTVPRFVVGMYGLMLMVGAAFMSITTLSRHTRVEEQTGRAELVRANVVGRHAQLTAALIVAATMSLVMSLLVGFIFTGIGVTDPTEHGAFAVFTDTATRPEAIVSAFLFAASLGAVALVFAGVSAVTAQLSAFPRTASGLASAALGVCFAVRGLGDMSALQGGDLGWLSWLSPLGWSQQTAPFTEDRWWPLLLSLATAVIFAALGYLLQSRRDLAAGILPDRLGPAIGPRWLRGPLSLVYRLQRSSLIGWSVALLLAGLAFGAFAQPIEEGAADMPPEIMQLIGGSGAIVDGYVGFIGVYLGIMVAVYAILSLQSLRAEEQGVRTEPVLAASVGRSSWLLSWVVVTALGTLWLLAVAGAGMGIGAASGLGDWQMFGRAVLGHVAHAPAVWVLLGLGATLYGWTPRLSGIVWAVFVSSAVLSMFGEMMDLDEAVLDTSVFQHVGQYPATDVEWAAVGGLSAIAAILVSVGVVGFRRRELVTA